MSEVPLQAHLGARLDVEGGAMMASKFDAAWLTGPGTAARFEGVMVSQHIKSLRPESDLVFRRTTLNPFKLFPLRSKAVGGSGARGVAHWSGDGRALRGCHGNGLCRCRAT
jgi:hypothetical protein